MPVDMRDEWHLHAFDATMLRAVAAGHLHVEQIVGVPHALLPLRWVARCVSL